LLFIYSIVLIFASSVFLTFLQYAKFRKLLATRIASPDYPLDGSGLANKILDRQGLKTVAVELAKQETIVHGNAVFVVQPNNAYFSEERKLTLTEDVYHGRDVASLTIAAHEASHALQHGEGFFPILMQIKVYPYLKILVLMSFLMIILNFIFQEPLVYLGVLLIYIIVLIYHFFTIYIEYDANRRAFLILRKTLDEKDYVYAKKMMKSSFLGYVYSTPFIIFVL